jgi:hypothetical protein
MAFKKITFTYLRKLFMNRLFIVSMVIIAGLMLTYVFAHSDHPHVLSPANTDSQSRVTVHAGGGDNPWNRGREPNDPWKAIEQMHGHVGPWNVLGWKIGQKALAEFGTRWGRHELDIIVYIPMDTPYSCMADGIVIGTGNSIGRLDIKLSPVPKMEMVCVEISKKTPGGPKILYKPKLKYLHKILTAPAEDIHILSEECFKMDNGMLFDEERIK